MLVGHQKGHTLEERTAVLLRLRHPEGYRKALSKMRLAAKFGLPIICLIDTPGAYPGIGAEERGQAQLIADEPAGDVAAADADRLRRDRRRGGRAGRWASASATG